jgi:hypothetical protein
MNPLDGGNEALAPGNIQLNYKIAVYFSGMETVLYAQGAEVFMDEHGIPWIKFFATSGPSAGKEHIMHTAEVVIVRDDGRMLDDEA